MTSLRRPRRTLLLVAAVIAVAALAGGAYGLWYLFLQGPPPAAVALATLPPLPSASAGGGTDDASPLTPVDLAGTWQVDTSIGSFGDFSDSFVGYRVQEQLASIGANTAVGRTPQVSGTLTISGDQVIAVAISADLTTLRSDDQRRDGQLGHQGLETSTYPTATFSLTGPLDLGSDPTDGREIDLTASGQLTLHGTTKAVQVPLKARLVGRVIEVTGSLPIRFADYGMQAPSSFAVLSVADQGTMEFQLFFSLA